MTISGRTVLDRVALVTGGASGIGRAVVELLAADGALVTAVDRDGGRLASVAAAASGKHPVRPVVADVTDPEQVLAAVAQTRAALGPVGIVIAAAGVSASVALDSDDYRPIWDRVLGVNLTATMTVIRACLTDLVADGAGRIVTIASTEALGATRRASSYVVSKHGVVGFTRALAVDLGRHGVTANCVCPGPINTSMTAAIPAADKETFARRHVPAGRYGEPAEVAHLVLSLVLPASSYVNGAVVTVDGGMTASNL